MKLKELLSTLQTKDVNVTLVDGDTDATIAVLRAEGYASLEDTIEVRAVKKWAITSATALKVVLGDVITDTANTDPASDPDPSNP